MFYLALGNYKTVLSWKSHGAHCFALAVQQQSLYTQDRWILAIEYEVCYWFVTPFLGAGALSGLDL